jgi:LysM repeat protein
MNTPSPLVPQGTLPQAARFKTNLRIAAVAIVAIHVVLFAGLLTQQGCKPDSKTAGTEATNALPAFDPAVFSPPPPPTPDPAPVAQPAVPPAVPPGAPPAVAQPAAPPAYQPAVPPAPPAASQPVQVPPPAPEPPPAPPAPAGLSEYTVKKGDYFEKIAKAHGLRTKDIVAANPGVDSTRLKVGQKLLLPAPSAPPAPAPAGDAGGETVHVVKSGDTLTKIAKQHGVSLKALRAANNLKTDQIKVGQKIKVPAAAPAPAAPPPAPEPVYVPVPAPPQPVPPPPAPPGAR